MTGINLTDLIWIVSLVLLNGFFVASEFAFVKIRLTQIEEMIKHGSRRAKRVAYIVHHLDRSLSSTQLGITIASIGLGFVGEDFFRSVFEDLFLGLNALFGINIFFSDAVLNFLAFIMGYLMITYLHVTIGELAPKSLSIQFAQKVALFCAEPLYWFMKVTGPLIDFFVMSSNVILKAIGVEPAPDEHHQGYSEEELKTIIKDSIKKGEIEPYESRLIFNVLDFTDSNVKSILTPRIDIEALPSDTTVNDIMALSIKTGFSRIPIYEGDLDKIVGFIHVKDVLQYSTGLIPDQPDFKLEDVLRHVITVPEGKPLDDLMKDMQRLHTQVAAIVDEYGTLEGIVTLEDIIEYIFGPIDDEFDSEDAKYMVKIAENKVIVGGQVSIEVFNNSAVESIGVEIESNVSTTLAGYVLELFDSEIPQIGDMRSDGQFIFKILQQNGNRIDEIEITKVIHIEKILHKNEIFDKPSPRLF